jgi:hypothetical protein
MDDAEFMALYKAGKFKEALGVATRGHEKSKLAPSRYSIDKKTGKPIFYRGNKRVELDEAGEWFLAKNLGKPE